MVINHLEELLETRGKTLNWLEGEIGIGYQRLHHQAHNRATMIKYSTLDRICAALNCTVGDILEFVPTPSKKKQ
jgi:putative transcriptional regulator